VDIHSTTFSGGSVAQTRLLGPMFDSHLELFYIHQRNWVNSHSGLLTLFSYALLWRNIQSMASDRTINTVAVIIIMIIVIVIA